MTIHHHILNGCSPTPLANYLKALGILRLVGEQEDRHARGWWDGDRFCLLTTLSKEELETFFLERYEPTPLLSPWNGGSGFYRTWDPKAQRLRNSKNAQALDELLDKGGTRVSSFKQAVEEAREILSKYCRKVDVSSISDKERGKLLILPEGEGPTFPVIPKDDSGKTQVQQVLVRFSRSTPFYQSVLVEVEEAIKFPWLWGTGGNDGGIDYAGRFFENLKLVIIPKNQQVNAKLLENALFDTHSTGSLSKAAGKIGKFFPAAAGGANVTTGTGSQHETHLNPWDYIFSLEGAILFISRATKRLDPSAIRKASAPFAVEPHAAGFATAGAENAKQGEQWMPIWSQPATLEDVSAMFGEARVQLDRTPANRPVNVARAISRLGIARGIEAFVRYGYLERNGKSMLAVPLGLVPVRQSLRAYLIDDLEFWMDKLHALVKKEKPKPPDRLIHAERRLSDAVLAALTHDYTPARWQAILEAAADIEFLQSTGTAIEAGPIPPLRPEWVAAINDGTPELRLALALGSAAGNYFKGSPSDSVRHHWLPLEKGARRFCTSDKRLVNDPRVVMSGRDPVRDLIEIVNRRLIESGMQGERRSRLVAAPGCGADLDDLAIFLTGAVDLNKLLRLARACMAIRWKSWKREHAPKVDSTKEREYPDPAWLAIRLSCLPWPLSQDMDIPADSRIVRLLSSGNAVRALDLVRDRLRSVGIRPPFQAGVADRTLANLWAAALAFPIHRNTARDITTILDPSMKGLLNV